MTPCLLLAIVVVLHGYFTQRDQSIALERRAAQQLSSEMQAFVADLERNLNAIGQIAATRASTPSDGQLIIDSLLYRRGALLKLSLVGADGNERARVSRLEETWPAPLRDMSQDEAFTVPATTGASHVGRLQFDAALGMPYITLSVPAGEPGGSLDIAAVVARVDLRPLRDSSLSAHPDGTGTVYIVDDRGILVLHPGAGAGLATRMFPAPQRDGIQRGLDGSLAVLARHPVSLGPNTLYVISETPVLQALAPVARTVGITLLVLVLTVVGASGISTYFARRIVYPIESLALTTQAAAAGDFSSQAQVTTEDEIGTLAGAVNSLIARARETIDNLESIVEERAQELVATNENLKTEIAGRQRVEEELRLQALELSRSNAELEQFAYVASHDLQEPLRAVAGFTQIIARRYQGKLDPQSDDFVERILNATTRMQTLIQDLLHYSRIGRQGVKFVPTDTVAMVEQELADLQVAIQQSSASITCDSLPTITADPSLLGIVFRNLISNAIKFRGADAPRIRISASRNEREWIFSVQDNGIGIDPQYADRIFVIFQRLNSRTEYEGTGIGLAICRKAVEYMGGRIWVESRPGNGAKFNFTIPVEHQGIPGYDETIAEEPPSADGVKKSADSVSRRASQLI